jgi:hypothetical protein
MYMKNVLAALSLMFLLMFPCLAQKNEKVQEEQTIKQKDVPEVILSAFKKSYPKSTIKGYSKETEEGRIFFEIESSEGKINRDVIYNPDGTIVSIEETLPLSKVPEPVRTSLKKEFPKAKVLKSEKIIKGTDIQYEFVVQSSKKSTEVVIDTHGKVIKKET